MLGDKSIGCNTVQILQDVNFANEYMFTKNREFSRDYVLNVATGDCFCNRHHVRVLLSIYAAESINH